MHGGYAIYPRAGNIYLIPIYSINYNSGMVFFVRGDAYKFRKREEKFILTPVRLDVIGFKFEKLPLFNLTKDLSSALKVITHPKVIEWLNNNQNRYNLDESVEKLRKIIREQLETMFSPHQKVVGQATDNLNFIRWFGNSPMKDEDGNPMVFYHGTTGDFEKFETKADIHTGFPIYYFTQNKDYANVYSKKGVQVGGNIIPVFLNVKKPFDTRKKAHLNIYIKALKDDGLRDWEIKGDLEDYFMGGLPFWENWSAYVIAKQNGFDSIIIKERETIESIAIFDNKNVKSIFSKEFAPEKEEIIAEKNISNQVPVELQDLYNKSLKFKDPKFYAKSTDGGVRFHTTWSELLTKIPTLERQGKDSEWIKNYLNNNYDVYGTKKPVSIQSLLNKEYNHPAEVPQEVYDYIKTHHSLLSSDATDAVRWSRVVGTENEERYPSGSLEVFRAVEKGYSDIRPGDWITTSEKYAEDHNKRYLDGKGHIISGVVDGKDVLVSPTGNYEEAIYAPLKYSKALNI